MFLTMAENCNVTKEGSHCSPLLRSKVIRLELEGSTAPSEFNKSFLVLVMIEGLLMLTWQLEIEPSHPQCCSCGWFSCGGYGGCA